MRVLLRRISLPKKKWQNCSQVSSHIALFLYVGHWLQGIFIFYCLFSLFWYFVLDTDYKVFSISVAWYFLFISVGHWQQGISYFCVVLFLFSGSFCFSFLDTDYKVFFISVVWFLFPVIFCFSLLDTDYKVIFISVFLVFRHFLISFSWYFLFLYVGHWLQGIFIFCCLVSVFPGSFCFSMLDTDYKVFSTFLPFPPSLAVRQTQLIYILYLYLYLYQSSIKCGVSSQRNLCHFFGS